MIFQINPENYKFEIVEKFAKLGVGGSENVIGFDVFRVWGYRVTLGHCTRHQGAAIKHAAGPRARRGRKELDPRCCNLGAHDF